jgi:hypothetical protein
MPSLSRTGHLGDSLAFGAPVLEGQPIRTITKSTGVDRWFKMKLGYLEQDNTAIRLIA